MYPFVSFALASSVLGGFGSLGFQHQHDLHFFSVSPSGFGVKGDTHRFVFHDDPTDIGVSNINRYVKTINMRPKGNSPLRIQYETTTSGFSLFYQGVLEWKSVGESPHISWEEGTVGAGVPSAPSKWVLLTWAKQRTPIMLCFPEPVSLVIKENDEGYILRSLTSVRGWVRVRSPFANDKMNATRVGDFGRIIQELKSRISFHEGNTPRVVDFSVSEKDDEIVAIWRFDKEGALVPSPLLNAREYGFVKIETPIEVFKSEQGNATAYSKSDSLRVRFYSYRLFPGSAVVNGKIIGDVHHESLSIEKISGVVNASLAYLAGNADSTIGGDLWRIRTQYIESYSQTTTEPFTGISLPFGRNGKGSYIAGGIALSAEIMGAGQSLSSAISSSIDWMTWLPMGENLEEKIKCASIYSISASLSDSLEERVLGAMCHFGALYADKNKIAPLSEVRSWLYHHPARKGMRKPDWLTAMQSPFRILPPGLGENLMFLSDNTMTFIGVSKEPETVSIRFKCEQAQVVSYTNISNLRLTHSDSVYTLRFTTEKVGQWDVKLNVQPSSRTLPNAALSPRYSEDPH